MSKYHETHLYQAIYPQMSALNAEYFENDDEFPGESSDIEIVNLAYEVAEELVKANPGLTQEDAMNYLEGRFC